MLDSQTAKALIKPQMPVVCSENGQFATVDHVEGTEAIKLTKDKSGQHHYIPLAWVTSVASCMSEQENTIAPPLFGR